MKLSYFFFLGELLFQLLNPHGSDETGTVQAGFMENLQTS
jgi:hypothetical protein